MSFLKQYFLYERMDKQKKIVFVASRTAMLCVMHTEATPPPYTHQHTLTHTPTHTKTHQHTYTHTQSELVFVQKITYSKTPPS
jgi:hypothetical protein